MSSKLSFARKLTVFLVLLALSNIALLSFIVYSLNSNKREISSQAKKLFKDIGTNTSDTKIYSSKEKAKACLEDSNKKLAKNDSDLTARCHRARACAFLDKHEEALKDINKLIALDGGNPDWYDMKADALSNLNRDAEALSALNQAIAIAPKVDRYLDRAETLYEMGRDKEALLDLNRHTNEAEVVTFQTLRRVALYEKCGDYKNCLLTLNEIIKKEQGQDYTDALLARARFYVRQGKYDAALDDYDTLNTKEEEQQAIYFEEASYILEAIGKREAAEVELREGLRLLEKDLADSSPADLDLFDQILELQIRKRLIAFGEPAKNYEQAAQKALQRTILLLDSQAREIDYAYYLKDLLNELPPDLGHKLGEKIITRQNKKPQADSMADAIEDTRAYLGLVKPNSNLAFYLKENNIYTLTKKAEDACDQGDYKLAAKFIAKAQRLRPHDYYPLAALIKLEIATKKLKEASDHLALLQKHHGMMSSQTANLLASLAQALGYKEKEESFLTLSAAIGDDTAMAKLKMLREKENY